MASQSTASIISLSDSGLTLADPATDVRGRTVTDRDGHEVGKVHSIMIDERERKARLLEVESGGFLGIGGETRLVPVDAVTDVTADDVRIDQTRERVHGSPGYDPELVRDDASNEPYLADLYGYYGYAPFWAPGFVNPSSTRRR